MELNYKDFVCAQLFVIYTVLSYSVKGKMSKINIWLQKYKERLEAQSFFSLNLKKSVWVWEKESLDVHFVVYAEIGLVEDD